LKPATSVQIVIPPRVHHTTKVPFTLGVGATMLENLGIRVLVAVGKFCSRFAAP
jgi:hypothetical protein